MSREYEEEGDEVIVNGLFVFVLEVIGWVGRIAWNGGLSFSGFENRDELADGVSQIKSTDHVSWHFHNLSLYNSIITPCIIISKYPLTIK